MKNKLYRLVALTLTSISVLSYANVALVHAGASAVMSLNPATQSVAQGSLTKLTIKIAAGSNKITGAQACIKYDATKLSLVNTDTSTSALSYTTPNSDEDCATGQIQVSRFSVSKPTGTFILGVITFKAIASGATTDITLDANSSFVRDDSTTDNTGAYKSILSTTSGAKLSLTNVPAASASSQPTSPSSNTKNMPALTSNENGQSTSAGSKTSSKGMMNDNDDSSNINSIMAVLCIIIIGVIATVLYKRHNELKDDTNEKSSVSKDSDKK